MDFEFEFNECECEVFGVTCVAKIVDGHRKLFRKSDNKLINDFDSVKQIKDCSFGGTVIDNEQYDEWVYEVMKLKPSKQKNWKSSLTDKWGQKTKCKYENDKFYNYSTNAHKWVLVYRRSRLDTMTQDESICDSANSMVGLLTLLTEKSLDKILEPIIESNRTSNHTGRVNHTIKVPPSTSSSKRC